MDFVLNRSFVLICILLMTIGLAISEPDIETKRVVNKPLSDEQHYEDDTGHNVDYDHEAFLGQDEAKTFEDLPPEESKRRLGEIVDKIDKDNDGFVTQKELQDWIQLVKKHYILDDIDQQWKSHNPDKKEVLRWEDYRKVTYGFTDDLENMDESDSEGLSYKDMIARDKRRWKAADSDGDDALNEKEFADFLHPEEAKHMQDVMIQETLEDVDKDKDGKVSLEEYIGDIYGGTGVNEGEPDWVKDERDQFMNFRDKDKDGFMDKEEIKDWILPPDYDHSETEARHLILESDSNKDQKLTKDEILEKYDLFVGSQATDFGEALMRHDEL
ncbi:calumenin-like [Limulus polyphemus]|uniref:Calumenin-like n=1 Tax=Limulus polyphemus TaxID=6850 RepID=A0ABM1BVA6_LIMPO|nr:calumenin-like [Limulus polyphemus]XP_022257410.1 calumenin-like [Limulus polyphemus]